jgi:hypothetical protein
VSSARAGEREERESLGEGRGEMGLSVGFIEREGERKGRQGDKGAPAAPSIEH